MVLDIISNQGQVSPPPPIQADASRAPQLSPSVVVIIVLITVIFFLSGFLHLLARCFARQSRREEDNSITSLQGQLQQLFHLHDAGVEQAFIDTLPVFFYKSVRGLKEGADCAVCLAEFQGEDRLRLLPKCSHAFHLDCIDTWLLSHSTCPLCRRSLLPENSPNLPLQSSALTVESGSSTTTNSSTNISADFAPDLPHPDAISSESAPKSSLPEIQNQTHDSSDPIHPAHVEIPPVLVPVKLGRFCPVDPSAPVSPRSGSKNRRSCSVGSYEYVLDPSNLQVFITPTPARKKWANFKPPTPGHRNALSECIPDRIGPFFAQHDELQFANRRLLVAENGSNRKNRAVDGPFVAFGINSNCGPNSSTLQWAPWKKAPDLGFKNSASRTDLASKNTASRTDLASKKCDRPAKTISFRFPAPDPKLKNSSSRRTLSESDMAPDLAWEVASSSLESVPEQLDAGSGSNKFARKALRWILRKDRRSTDRTDLV